MYSLKYLKYCLWVCYLILNNQGQYFYNMSSICVSLVLTPGHYELQNTSSYYSFSHKQTRNDPVSWTYKENKSWLNHTVINACENLLKRPYKPFCSLYTVVLVMKRDVMIEMKFMSDNKKENVHQNLIKSFRSRHIVLITFSYYWQICYSYN